MASGRGGAARASAAFETTCPRCGHGFDVGATEATTVCPRCALLFRLTDEGPAPTGPPVPPGATGEAKAQAAPPERRSLTRREKAALANAILAPAVCADAVNVARLAFLDGSLEAAVLAGAVPIAVALASAILAWATGLRGLAWLAPAASIAIGLLAWLADPLLGLVAAVYLPPASLVATGALLVACAVSALSHRLARHLVAFQVAGLAITFAIAVIAAQTLWFLGELVKAFG